MDLTTQYLGMQLKNPLVPSASPLSRSIDDARRMHSLERIMSISSTAFAPVQAS
ncbi:MAG: hypothetical protein JMN25_09660 [gamma proteobacterium endosymbiont of Lamellibrachia anaximandri]|nr:hypothetical protein [gamma proteobacterium endosymbiont of Lamellibrachia anaximandri]